MITVRYSCHDCGLEDVPCDVPERADPTDIANWVQFVLADALYNDHRLRSPDCHVSAISEVKIPITGAKYLGGPAVQ